MRSNVEMKYIVTILLAFLIANAATGQKPTFKNLSSQLVAAFKAPRASEQDKARTWLESYACENYMACVEEDKHLDLLIKENVLTMKAKQKNRVEKIRQEVRHRLDTFAAAKPSAHGFCAPESDRKKWFELAYQIHCPFGDHKETEQMMKLIQTQSAQEILSSSYLISFKHVGQIDCSKPWVAEIECFYAGKQPVYRLNCHRMGEGAATEVSCAEM